MSAGAAPRGRLRRFVAAHLSSRQVSRVVYGSIIGLALVVALEAHPPPPGAVVASLLGTAVAVGLAELYSELVGFETTRRRKAGARRAAGAGRRHRRRRLRHRVPGRVLPAGRDSASLEDETAFTVAKWTGVGLIGVYGFAGARLSGAGLPRRARAGGRRRAHRGRADPPQVPCPLRSTVNASCGRSRSGCGRSSSCASSTGSRRSPASIARSRSPRAP